MTFLYETNILNQPSEWRRVIDIPLPSRLSDLDFKRIYFIGIGSSFWAAKIAEFLWREYVQMDAIAIQSHDFVNSRYFVSPNDIVVVFSHRGTKTFSVRALEMAKRHYHAYTVLITGLPLIPISGLKHAPKRIVELLRSHLHQLLFESFNGLTYSRMV